MTCSYFETKTRRFETASPFFGMEITLIILRINMHWENIVWLARK